MKLPQFQKIILILSGFLLILSCASADKTSPIDKANNVFLKDNDPEATEVFRALITSDSYRVFQLKNNDTITRAPDPGGDRFICDEIKKLDKINEAREGIIKIWLYPDSGKLMKVRPMELTYLVEVDNLIIEDIQRWSFKFPNTVIQPHQFEIKYRVVLQKKMTDNEIMREVREKMKSKGMRR